MTKLNPWVFGLVVAITVVISYVLCTLFWLAFTDSSMDFLNTVMGWNSARSTVRPRSRWLTI